MPIFRVSLTDGEYTEVAEYLRTLGDGTQTVETQFDGLARGLIMRAHMRALTKAEKAQGGKDTALRVSME